jgi:hypothetical protein
MSDFTTGKPTLPSFASVFISIFGISYLMLLWLNSSLSLATTWEAGSTTLTSLATTVAMLVRLFTRLSDLLPLIF